MEKNNLTSQEQRIYDKEEFKVYESLDDDYYILHNKYSEDDRYKVEQCRNNQSILKVIHEGDLLDTDLKVGDILRKVDGKYVLDEAKTKEVKEKLEEIKQSIIQQRN